MAYSPIGEVMMDILFLPQSTEELNQQVSIAVVSGEGELW